jgi:hypothetical protein
LNKPVGMNRDKSEEYREKGFEGYLGWLTLRCIGTTGTSILLNIHKNLGND